MTRRYPAYRDSGVDWMGDVPCHWVPCRSDEVLRSSSDSVDAEALNGQTVFHYSIPVVQETGTGAYEEGDEIESSKGIVSEAQVLVSKLNPRKGTVCIAVPADKLTVCSGEFIPLIPISADLRYVFYTAMSDVFRQRLEARVESATKSHQRVLPSDITKFPWVIPPLPEQTAIAAFLDVETAKIDALVEEQRRLIDLLKEKRQAVISHAVTRGLNPAATLKTSGVEWLGDVPEGWEVLRLASLFREVSEPGEDNLPILSVSIHTGVSDDELPEDELERKVTRSDDRTKYKTVRPSDLTYNMMRAWQGGFGAVKVSGMVSPAYVVARPISSDRISTEFVELLLRTHNAVVEMKRNSRGVTDFRLRLYWDEFKAIFVALPSVEEQCEILDYISAKVAEFDALSKVAETAIILLQVACPDRVVRFQS